MKQCPQCGQELNDNDSFCHKCGAMADSKPQTAPPQAKSSLKPQIKKPNVNWGAIFVVAIVLIAVVFGAIFIASGGIDFNKKATEDVEISIDSIMLSLDPDVDPKDQLYKFEDGYRVCIQVIIDGKSVMWPSWPKDYYAMEAGVAVTPENNTITVSGVGLNSDIVIFVYTKTASESVMNPIDIYSEEHYSGHVEKFGVSGVLTNQKELGKIGNKVTLIGDTYPLAELSLSFKFTSN